MECFLVSVLWIQNFILESSSWRQRAISEQQLACPLITCSIVVFLLSTPRQDQGLTVADIGQEGVPCLNSQGKIMLFHCCASQRLAPRFRSRGSLILRRRQIPSSQLCTSKQNEILRTVLRVMHCLSAVQIWTQNPHLLSLRACLMMSPPELKLNNKGHWS